ncbi:hypothetical protein P692DRAFT_201703156, partial [Suillus brevipes Sb2]
IADGLSRQWEGQPRDEGMEDGSTWTVSEDWDTNSGLINDILFMNTNINIDDFSSLRQRFTNEPVFLQVIESIGQLDSTKPLRDCKRAKHQASQYLIEDGKLWCLRGGTTIRTRSRVECVNKDEARQMASRQHEEGGHWGRDAIKIVLLDRICSPGVISIYPRFSSGLPDPRSDQIRYPDPFPFPSRFYLHFRSINDKLSNSFPVHITLT